jgi:hypothetical protein
VSLADQPQAWETVQGGVVHGGEWRFDLALWSGLLTDEFTYSGFFTDARYANVGVGKITASSRFTQAGDFA